MTFDDSAYRFLHVPPLTEEQGESPFAKFYYVPVPAPAPEVMASIGAQQLPETDALDFEKIETLFRSESDSVKNGWCIRPDGTGYSMVTTEMPLVTPEMEAWWTKWFLDPSYDWLNYRIWMPGLHVSHAMPIIENLGWGNVSIEMFQPLSPGQLGLSASPKALDSRFLAAIGSSGRCRTSDSEASYDYNVLLSVIKCGKQGLKVHTVNYMGVKWDSGHLIKMHDADSAKLRLFVTHNAYEFRRKALLLPELYAYAQSLPNQGLNPDVKPPVFP